MKRKVFALTISLLAFFSIQAQDTVFGYGPDTNNYFVNFDWWWKCQRLGGVIILNPYGDIARDFYTDDSLVIYGIAGSVIPEDFFARALDWGHDWPDDTSLTKCSEAMRLYRYDSANNTLIQQGEDLWVHVVDTPVSYYMQFGQGPVVYGTTSPIIPVYERYFHSPQVIVGDFYVGFTQRTAPGSDAGISMAVTVASFVGSEPDTFLLRKPAYQVPRDGRIVWRITPLHYVQEDYFIFPIITPPDTTVNPFDTIVNSRDTIVVNPGDSVIVIPGDTLILGSDTIVNTGDTVIVIPGEPVIIGGDTLVVNPGDSIIVIPGNTDVGIQPNDLIYRYTNVAPNPARNSVRITSSFGISRIEAYDLRGRRIYESPQLSTFSFPLSTIDWPRGTYLLRITTPAGPTTKKLLIQ